MKVWKHAVYTSTFIIELILILSMFSLWNIINNKNDVPLKGLNETFNYCWGGFNDLFTKLTATTI